MSIRTAAPAAITTALLCAATPAVAQDLEPTSIQINATGSNPRVTVTIANSASTGSAIAAGQAVTLFEGPPVNNLVLANLSTSGALAAGQSESLTFDLAPGFAFVGASGVSKTLHARVDPANALAESNEANNDIYAYQTTQGLNPVVPRQNRVLVVTINGASYNGWGVQLANTVAQAGGQVTHQILSSNGQVANLLANNTYDQVWVYDLNHRNDPYSADWAAIAAWFNQNNTREIIADGRIIASLWNNLYATEGKLVSDNYYSNLRVRGGGLMLGTDHGGGTGPTNGAGIYPDGINDINDQIGIGRFWGNPGGAVAGMPAADPNPLRNIPNNLAIPRGGSLIGLRSDSSPGNAPTGFQDATNVAPGVTPLGRTFYTLAWHNGSSGGGASTPAISTTIQGSLGFGVQVDTQSCRVAAAGATNVLTLAITAGAVAPLAYEWSVNGVVVSTTATFDTATLPSGDHTVNVVVTDATGFRPGDSVLVSIDGADCNNSCTPDSEDIALGLVQDTLPQDGIPDICQDQDGDGVPDGTDTYPCDPATSGVMYSPGQNQHAALLYEDEWPLLGDADFNDAVISYNYVFRTNASGNVVSISATYSALALGGVFDNGLGIQFPFPASSVSSVTRTVGTGSAQALTPAIDANFTVRLSNNLRELYGNQPGQINSVSGPSLAGQIIQVDVQLSTPVSPSLVAGAPFDLYLFSAGDPRHEIHQPAYSGTSNMDGTLFGTNDDNSNAQPGIFFVDGRGLPFVLHLPVFNVWPQEGVDIALLFPNIINFALTSGAQDQDFYINGVNLAYAYFGTPTVQPGFLAGHETIDQSCLTGP